MGIDRPAAAAPSHREAVKVVADTPLPVTGAAGAGVFRLYVSRDWSKPDPSVTRAVTVIHGRLRNAVVYRRSAETALVAAGPEAQAETLLVTPQFLADQDIPARDLPPDTLRWTAEGWMGGEPATGPAPVSSFEALDAIMDRLADRALFPNLRQIVIAGHSAGGQVVQRYAAAFRKDAALARLGVRMRFVVANPSSYLYFSADRSTPTDPKACPDVDRWKYGLQDRPPYAADRDAPTLEAEYVARDVVMLLGAKDADPNHRALDRSCAAEAQGPNRLARGLNYFDYLSARHPDGFRHVLRRVAGVGHNGDAMLTSPCGLRALFDAPGCDAP
ncbi:alpha/beta hydrolase [Methylopila henanensis]|uniref:Alpha/beta hydrolase n=1 Tax=Methylopila henanensis TaxID=873516 RepID=A0ABW4K943_9HYPH